MNLFNIHHKAFPEIIHIENTNLCNASCIICPRDKMTRSKGVMNMELFSTIISECKNHADYIREIHLHGYGEPLIDEMLLKKIELLNDYNFKKIYLVSNGSLISKVTAQGLINRLDEIKISYYSNNRYKRIHTGLDQELVDQGLRVLFLERYKRKGIKPSIIIQLAPELTTISDSFEIIKKWFPYMDSDLGDSFSFTGIHNWASNYKDYKSGERRSFRCNWPLVHIYIAWDGNVLPCVFDINSTMIMGYLDNDNISQIWRSREYRTIYFNRDTPLCEYCDVPKGDFKPKKLDSKLIRSLLKSADGIHTLHKVFKKL